MHEKIHIHKKALFYSFKFFVFWNCGEGQIANYVNNGGFENKIDCQFPNVLNRAIGWNSIGQDTNVVGGLIYSVNCYSNAPLINGTGFQFPRTGETFIRIVNYCTNPCSQFDTRRYPKNRLKSKLSANKIYCIKAYFVLEEASPLAIDGIGYYIGRDLIDTIKYATMPLTYLTPQVSNPNGNIITDTLNWIAVSGTFQATGDEKYLVIGNFKSDAATTKSLMIPSSTESWSEYFVDDVSCIPIDLPAYAGADKSCIVGDSVFIGRTPDVEIDESCQWFKWPNMATPIATVAGLYVKPVVTTTYVVRQQLWCSGVRWDTMVVYKDYLGLASLSGVEGELVMKGSKLFIEGSNVQNALSVQIVDVVGNVIFSKVILSENEVFNFSGQQSGIYVVSLSGASSDSYRTSLSTTGVVRKKLVYVAEE